MNHPTFDRRQICHGFRVWQRFHDAATRVSAYDDGFTFSAETAYLIVASCCLPTSHRNAGNIDHSSKLVAAARQAGKDASEGKASPIDYERL